jgi:two-component system, chemotaxis family, protein-glutamate methylesterase/glutaminase
VPNSDQAAKLNRGADRTRAVRVLVVDDCAVTREYLTHMFNASRVLEVIGTACNGAEALRFIEEQRPDVVTMDVNMPVMNGFEATRHIMSTDPLPIVILTASWDSEQVNMGFKALEAGALAALAKPRGLGHAESPAQVRELVSTVRALSEVKLVTRRWRDGKGSRPVERPRAPRRNRRILAVGTSTGGPPVLQRIMSALPADYPWPVVVVQHISPGFLEGMVDWLDQGCAVRVCAARDGDLLRPGVVYLAPDDVHMVVTEEETIALLDVPADNGLRPAVGRLFQSVADVYGGSATVVLLTGMGKDGAAELKKLRDCGAATIVQNRETCVVFGMPGEAVRLDAAMHTMSPDEIADFLVAEVARV